MVTKTINFDNSVYTEGQPAGTHLAQKFQMLTTEQWETILEKDEKFQKFIREVSRVGEEAIRGHMIIEVSLFGAGSAEHPFASGFMNHQEIRAPSFWITNEVIAFGIGTLTHARIVAGK